jgi:phage shock protein A
VAKSRNPFLFCILKTCMSIPSQILETLTSDEEILYNFEKPFKLKSPGLVFTNKRLIYYKSKSFGVEIEEYSWRDVHDISMDDDEIEFEMIGDHEIEFEDIPKSRVREMYAIAKKLKENAYASSKTVVMQTAASDAQDDLVAKLKQLKDMLDAGLINQEEYENTKTAILAGMSRQVPSGSVPSQLAYSEMGQRKDNMGLLDRICTAVQAKMNTIMGIQDPRDALDLSYEKQLSLLQNVKRSVAEFNTSKERIEQQRIKLQSSIDQLEAQAKNALLANREDLARTALEKKAALLAQLSEMDRQIADLEDQQRKLMAAESRLAAKVESFRTKKETIKAQYSVAEAQAKLSESVTGISEEMADVGLAVQRAEEKTENMKARFAALDELLESGTLTDLSGSSELEHEIAQAKAKSSVDDELAKMKAEMDIRTHRDE